LKINILNILRQPWDVQQLAAPGLESLIQQQGLLFNQDCTMYMHKSLGSDLCLYLWAEQEGSHLGPTSKTVKIPTGYVLQFHY